MRTNSRTPIIVICLSSLLMISAAPAADYWPVVDDLTWNYGTSAAALYPIRMVVFDGGFYLSEPNPYVSTVSRFRVNGEGDIEATSWARWHQYGLDSASFDPPLLFLDLPLAVGKVWESVNSTGGLRGEVLREESVTVPAGTYQVMVVRVSDILNGGLFVGDYYLERNIGNVKHDGVGLYSITGTVAEDSRSWGALKALFR